ncbi:MAG: YhjD/YihY/BrkB family envelope integrity protein, partial [Steroidobacteraceae bacterium]
MGAALAFYCAFAIAPLLVILLQLAGLFLNENATEVQVGMQLTAIFGPGAARVLIGAVRSAQRSHGVTAMVVSAATLVIGATTVMATLEAALEVIWRSPMSAISGIRGWIRRSIVALGFI